MAELTVSRKTILALFTEAIKDVAVKKLQYQNIKDLIVGI